MIINKDKKLKFYIKSFYIQNKVVYLYCQTLILRIMRAIIENSVKIFNPETGIYFGDKKYFESLGEFNLILTRIINADNEEQLRSSTRLDVYENFIFGFGSNHMWVKQVMGGEPKQQVIFVEF